MSKFPGNFPLHRIETVNKENPEDRESPVQVKFEDHSYNIKLALVKNEDIRLCFKVKSTYKQINNTKT